MLDQNLNIYSLLMPTLMLCLAVCTWLLYLLKKMPEYLATYASALFCIGICMFFHTVLDAEAVVEFYAIAYFFYFLACALHISAVHQRLNLDIHGLSLILLILLGSLGIHYFSVVNNNQVLRMFFTSCITVAIYLHRPRILFKHTSKLKIDRYLKRLIYIVAIIALCRAIVLSLFVDVHEQISRDDILWASTQLLILLVDLIFLGIFIGCSIQDVVLGLKSDRNHDHLTGLMNRRGLKEHLQQMSKRPISHHALLLADLDYFKNINDRYGHHIGDLVLQHTSRIFRENIRKYDRVARIGGEEFIIVLNDTNYETTLNMAERIRMTFEQQPFILAHENVHITLSIGVSFFKHQTSFEKALQHADDLLYQAKKMGRNQVKSALFHPQHLTEI